MGWNPVKKVKKVVKKVVKPVVQGLGRIPVGGGANVGSRPQPIGGETYEVGYSTQI